MVALAPLQKVVEPLNTQFCQLFHTSQIFSFASYKKLRTSRHPNGRPCRFCACAYHPALHGALGPNFVVATMAEESDIDVCSYSSNG